MATFNYRPPQAFEFSNPAEWPNWRQRYESFHSICGLKNCSEKEQVDSLIYTMGEHAEVVFEALKLSEADSCSYSKVLEAFESHFVGKRNIIYERAKFNMRVQGNYESVDEFITSLHNLAKHCEYGTLTDDLIRDRIVAGVLDKSLSEKMQLDCNLTLEKATLMAKQSERIKKQQGTIHSKDLEVHVVRTPRNNRNETKDKNRNNKNNYKSTQNVAREKLNSCNFCGGQYHKRTDCPALKATCRNCSKIGHYFKVCRNKPKLNVVTGVHSQENFLGKVTTLEENRGQKDNWLVSLTVRNKMLTFKIDTGADVNVLPENCVNKCFPNIKLESSDKKLTGLDGKIHRTKGMFRETVKYNSKSTLATFYVVPGAETALLSGNTSEKLGLLKRLNAISDEREGEILDPAKAFPEIFEGLGKAKVKYEIQLRPDAKPYALITPRRVPIALMGKVKDKIESI